MMMMMNTENDEKVVPLIALASEKEDYEYFDDEDEGLNEDSTIVFVIDPDAEELIVYFGGDKQRVLSLNGDTEVMIVDRVLHDGDFWDQFLESFYDAIQKTLKGE
jgi:uncharacterized protein YprB with RNaseH-like and TPR domain